MKKLPFKFIFLKFLPLLLFLPFSLSVEKGYSSDPVGLTAESYLNFGITSIYSPDSFSAWGKVENSSAFSFRGQLWYMMLKHRRFEARLGAELILTHRIDYPLNGVDGIKDNRTGFGIIPLNVMVPFTSSRVQPFGFFSAGALALNEKFPVGSGASINYLLNMGGGIELPFIQNTKLQIGYSIQHMSNANTGNENPGIDSHMLFLTLLFP